MDILTIRNSSTMYGLACAIAALCFTGAPPVQAAAAAGRCGALADVPAIRASQGVWEGEWWVRDRAGNVLRHYRTVKTQRLFNNVFYQVTKYDYPDRPARTRRFFARYNAQCEVEFYGVDQPTFAAVQLLQHYFGEHSATRLEIERATGKVTGVEYFTQIGAHRLMSVHRFDANKGGEAAPVVTVYEDRVRDAPPGALFQIPTGQYWDAQPTATGSLGTAVKPAAVDSGRLTQFAQHFSGEFDNRAQIAQEEAQRIEPALRHAVAHFSLVPLEVPGLGRSTYVEQYRDGNPDNVTYQRIFVHSFDARNGDILSRLYELPAARRIRRGDLTALRSEELKALPEGCAIRWRPVNAEFRGQQSPETCRRPGPGGSEMLLSDELRVSSTDFWTNTRITTPDGRVVYANGGGVPLRMRRVP